MRQVQGHADAVVARPAFTQRCAITLVAVIAHCFVEFIVQRGRFLCVALGQMEQDFFLLGAAATGHVGAAHGATWNAISRANKTRSGNIGIGAGPLYHRQAVTVVHRQEHPCAELTGQHGHVWPDVLDQTCSRQSCRLQRQHRQAKAVGARVAVVIQVADFHQGVRQARYR